MASQTQQTTPSTLGPVSNTAQESTSKGWSASRSSIMVLVSIILLFAASAAMYFANRAQADAIAQRKPEPLVWEILIPIADAMLVVSITVLLTELGPFRSYVEERLQGLRQVLDRPILERLTDAAYLRDNFTPELIRCLQRASTCASLPAHIKDYPEFLKVIDKCVIPFAGETIWRKDFHLNVSHSLLEENGHTLIQQKLTLSATYLNTGNRERTLNIPIVRKYAKLSGIADDRLCCKGWVKVRAEGASHEESFPLTFQQTDLGDVVEFQSNFSITVGTDPVFVSTGYEAIVGPNEIHRQSMSVPTVGLTVTYQHPPQVKPDLLCFSVGGELKVISEDEMLHQWEHTGTFLPNHGAVLSHSLTRRKGDKKIEAQGAGDQRVERRRA
jgi:hypothetical protein